MPDLVCNNAKGRVVELAYNVEAGTPAAARFYVIPIAAGAATDDQLRDANTFADIITAGATELAANGWDRKTITSTELVVDLDDSGNLADVDINIDLLWTSVTAGTATDLVICYSSVAQPGGGNAALVPLTVHDFTVTPDGSNVTAQVATEGFYRAT
jgi:hypothetical protein